jgi:hypothetical protein
MLILFAENIFKAEQIIKKFQLNSFSFLISRMLLSAREILKEKKKVANL